jgi:uncharacterized membrane protein YhaH (DUF805 family)
MSTGSNNYWFKRKLYGWGWVPATWQGWLVILVWLLLFTFSIQTLDHEWLKNIFVTTILTVGLIYICYKKGEKPRWQWGKDKK